MRRGAWLTALNQMDTDEVDQMTSACKSMIPTCGPQGSGVGVGFVCNKCACFPGLNQASVPSEDTGT